MIMRINRNTKSQKRNNQVKKKNSDSAQENRNVTDEINTDNGNQEKKRNQRKETGSMNVHAPDLEFDQVQQEEQELELDQDQKQELNPDYSASGEPGLYETDEAGHDSGDPKEEIIRKLMAELEHKKDQLLRKSAEFENMRKRVQNDRIKQFEDARIDAILKFLPVNDDLQRTVKVLKDSGLDETYLKGIELVAGKMENVLNHYNVEKIDETGVPFNVNLHDALMRQKAADENTPPDTVLQILEYGYKIGDRVIRHAKVIVSE
jgi:molecular chaperone GrpE